jgi:hypothetical protein
MYALMPEFLFMIFDSISNNATVEKAMPRASSVIDTGIVRA